MEIFKNLMGKPWSNCYNIHISSANERCKERQIPLYIEDYLKKREKAKEFVFYIRGGNQQKVTEKMDQLT